MNELIKKWPVGGASSLLLLNAVYTITWRIVLIGPSGQYGLSYVGYECYHFKKSY